jgi:hypothetical protein
MFTSGMGAATSASRREIGSLEKPALVESFTSRIDDVARSSLETTAADATSVQDSANGIYPVDRSSTGAHETAAVLSTLGPASRTTSEYRASAETGTEHLVPVMIAMAGGPVVDRTSTGVQETAVSTLASVAEKLRGEPAMVETFTLQVAAISESKVGEMGMVGHQSCGDKASRYVHP